MPKKNYELKAIGSSEAELLIYGDIGESWFEETVTAKQVAADLAEMNVDYINVRINSYGGSVSDGITIHNVLRKHDAAVNISIEGVAISIASLIAMAGDTVEMSANAMFMVHAPWSGLMGNAVEMREFADILDKYADAMSSSYMRKTGKSKEEILSMLTDGEDHYFTAQEALDFGFVDVISENEVDVAAGFRESKFFETSVMNHQKTITVDSKDLTSSTKLAALVAAIDKPKKEDIKMPQETKDELAAKSKAAENTAVQAALAAEQQRSTDIRNAFAPFAEHEGVSDLMNSCVADQQCDAHAAGQKLLAKLAEGCEPISSGSVEIEVDEVDKRIDAGSSVLLVRAGVHNMKGNGHKPVSGDLTGNPFKSSTLLEIAKACVGASGKSTAGMNKLQVVAAAFQSTSDFPVLLENVMHKTLLAAYATTPDTWTRFCSVGSVSDFRAHNRYKTGSIGNLDSLNEHGEFERKAVPDGEKESITAGTKGNIIAITREAIINDDLNALVSLAIALGRSYRRTIEAAVYSLLAENSGLGPNMTDGNPLFDASHSNLGAGAAISVVALEADRVVMASQTGVGGTEILDMTPSILLVPLAIGGTARVINEAQYDPDTASKLQRPNMVNGLFSDIVDTARLTGTRRYMFADPNIAPVIEVAFLDGVQEPYIEAKDGWNVDGAELKVRGDFGVAATDFRGGVTDAGA